MITDLSFSNFKSWKQVNRMQLAPITGLFGTNSSGKTSILQLLLLMRQTVESTDRMIVLDFGDDRGLVQLGLYRDVVFGHQVSEAVTLDLDWKLPATLKVEDPAVSGKVLFQDDRAGFSMRVGNGNEKLSVHTLEYKFAAATFGLRRKEQSPSKYDLYTDSDKFAFKRSIGRVWDLPAPVKCYGFPDQTFAYYQNAGFLADLQLALENLFRRVQYLGPLREPPKRHYAWSGAEPADMGRRGEKVIDAILASRERGKNISPGKRKHKQTLEERVAFWLKELGLIHSFHVKPIAEGSSLYEVKVRRSPGSADALITDVGFGVSQILPVLVLCYYVPEGSTILLEQPEIHLHPSVQSGLADVFIDVVKNRNVQIILESHSEHLLKRLQRRIAEESLPRGDVSLFFCDFDGAKSVLKPLNVDLFGAITNWPKDFFGDEFGEMAAMQAASLKRRLGGAG